VLADNANIAAALGSQATFLGQGEVGGGHSSAGIGPQTSTATDDVTFDQALLSAHQDLLVSLYAPTGGGAGITGIDFSITENGSTLVSRDFVSIKSATTYFTDHPIQLGAVGSSTAVSLQVSLAVTSVKPGAGFDAGFLIAERPV
jgi:hypothetical protein